MCVHDAIQMDNSVYELRTNIIVCVHSYRVQGGIKWKDSVLLVRQNKTRNRPKIHVRWSKVSTTRLALLFARFLLKNYKERIRFPAFFHVNYPEKNFLSSFHSRNCLCTNCFFRKTAAQIFFSRSLPKNYPEKFSIPFFPQKFIQFSLTKLPRKIFLQLFCRKIAWKKIFTPRFNTISSFCLKNFHEMITLTLSTRFLHIFSKNGSQL